jgi:hypothetical protein
MTYLAAKPHPVKPVRKYNRSHISRIGIIVYHHIAVFCVRIADCQQINSNEYHKKQQHNGQQDIFIVFIH